MTDNYVAHNDNELSVHRGQQVLLLDTLYSSNGNVSNLSGTSGADADWCLVRSTVEGENCEGLVPMANIKQVTSGLKSSGSRTSIGDAGR